MWCNLCSLTSRTCFVLVFATIRQCFKKHGLNSRVPTEQFLKRVGGINLRDPRTYSAALCAYTVLYWPLDDAASTQEYPPQKCLHYQLRNLDKLFQQFNFLQILFHFVPCLLVLSTKMISCILSSFLQDPADSPRSHIS